MAYRTPMPERSLGKLPDGTRGWTVEFAARGDRAALLAGGAVTLFELDAGARTPRQTVHAPYDAIRELGFSPDGAHLAYIGDRGGKTYVVADGTASAPYANARSIQFLPGGQVAYLAEAVRGGAAMVVGNQVRPLPYRDARSLVFAPDGVAWAFITVEDAEWRVVHAGRAGPPHGHAGEIAFSPDGTRLAYVAGDGRARSACVVVDGEPGPRFDAIGQPVFSLDGRRVIYAAKTKGQHRLVEDHEVGDVAAAWLGQLTFAPDGRLAYLAGVGARRQLRWGDEPGPLLSAIDHIAFSPTGDHVAYRGKDGTALSVYIDNVAGDEYPHLHVPVFVDERTVGFGAVRKDTLLWVERKVGTAARRAPSKPASTPKPASKSKPKPRPKSKSKSTPKRGARRGAS
jgi:hypothetical protein